MKLYYWLSVVVLSCRTLPWFFLWISIAPASGLIFADSLEPGATAWSLTDPVAGSQSSSHLRSWSIEANFCNHFRAARRFRDGWIVPTGMGGEMVLRYQGPHEPEPGWLEDMRLPPRQDQAQILERAPGRLRVRLPEGHQWFIRTPESDTSLLLTRVDMAASCEQGVLFYPEFLDKLRAGAVLRAIQWQQVNYWYEDSPTAELRWEDRTPPTGTQAQLHGISLEMLAAAANAAGVDLWYVIPERADDDFARRAAELLHRELDPSLRLFIEVGNEVWNGIPPYLAGQQWMIDEAMRRGGFELCEGEEPGGGLHPDCHSPTDPVNTSDYAQGLMMHAVRSAEVGEIFEQVFGDERTVVVLAQQVGMAYFHRFALNLLRAYNLKVEALAIAAYFGAELNDRLGVDDDASILQGLRDSLEGEFRDRVLASGAEAARQGLPLIGYEGGIHLVPVGGWDATLEAREQLERVNMHPDLEAIYDHWLEIWDQAGGGLMMHYGLINTQDSQWGAWGMFPATDSPPTPKSRAFYRWAAYP